MRNSVVFIFLLFSFWITAQNPQAYQIFNGKGQKSHYGKLLKQAQKQEIVLFGEYHDNAVVHWLQLLFTKDMHSKTALVFGAEMFEADNQEALNKYLAGEINQKGLDTLARLWSNYKTDYKPLVDFAKEYQLPFVATNIPRRYASMVFKGDFEALESLTSEEKSWIAPLPILYDENLQGYKAMLEMMGGHASATLPKAQAIKDATMAHFILQNLKNNSVFIHFNGTYHSDNYEGIYWYLKQHQPELKIMTIATVTQTDLSKLSKEHLGKADFILVVDEFVTKTY
ncbi:MAG: ChaN family lipoprotein [Flavobacterium sp.]